MDYKITPKSLILSILHVAGRQPVPIKALVVCGDLFGFTSNTIRVNAARLYREGTIESDERGLYRLGSRKNPLSRYIDGWRNGPTRIRPWDGCWTCCWQAQVPVNEQPGNQKAIQFMGFRQGLPGLWVRPNNLMLTLSEISALLMQMGLPARPELFIGAQFDANLTEQWQHFLWPMKDLLQTADHLLNKLTASRVRLPQMPLDQAVVESFRLGGEVIHFLITDPLLPKEIMADRYRRKLTQAMLNYDELGKEIWTRKFKGLCFETTPAHARLVQKTVEVI